MRKLLVLPIAAALFAPNGAASSWSQLSSPSAPAPTTSTTVSNPAPSTTSPYNGFTATGSATSYSGTLTTISSGGSGSWGAATQTATSVVNNTSSAGVSWAPQSTQPVTGGTAYAPTVGGWGSWASLTTMSAVSSPQPLSPVSVNDGGVYYSMDNPEPGTVLTVLGGVGVLFLLWRRNERKKLD